MNLEKVIEGLEMILEALKEADKAKVAKKQPEEDKKEESKVTLEEVRAMDALEDLIRIS